ncbi:hypothetical protein ACIBL3_33925 [Kribbella sp. NPDC050124]|uniref:hypothetical protein n=1 Tax=Kribbella sp. NPDC050124 TaxID=3364114 RepID=UPI0037BDC7F5
MTEGWRTRSGGHDQPTGWTAQSPQPDSQRERPQHQHRLYTNNLGFKLLHTFGDPADFAILGHDEREIYLCHKVKASSSAAWRVQ